MRLRTVVFTIALFTSVGSWASHDETLQQLVERAESASVEDKPALYLEAANRQLASAADLYHQGNAPDGQKAVADVVAFSRKAHDSSAQTGKKLKNTEIALRKLAARLRDLRMTLNAEDQPPLVQAADTLEDLRTDLMSRIWGKSK
jgi:hypothetical protein